MPLAGDAFTSMSSTTDSDTSNMLPSSTTGGESQAPITISAPNTPSNPTTPSTGFPALNTPPGSLNVVGAVPSQSPTSAPNTPTNQTSATAGVRTPPSRHSCFSLSFNYWREHAWYFAGSFGGLALTIFFGGTVVGISDGMEALWVISSIFVGVLALGAMISAAVACRDSIRRFQLTLPTTAAVQPLGTP